MREEGALVGCPAWEDDAQAMMSANRFLGRALLASLLLHAFVAYVLPPLATVPSTIRVETISFAKVRRIEIEHRAAHAPAAAVHPTRVARVPVPRTMKTPAPARKAPAKREKFLPVRVAQAPGHPGRTAPMIVPTTGPANATPRPQVSTTASARDVATTTAGEHAATGYMPFGTDQPPMLNPQARAQLEALNVHVTLTIVVTDSGKTKSVSFAPPLDAQTEAQIENLLASASWDPAYCGGGIPCEMPTVIKL